MATPIFIKQKYTERNKVVPLVVLRNAYNKSLRITRESSWYGWIILICTLIATIFTVADYFESRQGQSFINITVNFINKD
jgi:hypothetical protein